MANYNLSKFNVETMYALMKKAYMDQYDLEFKSTIDAIKLAYDSGILKNDQDTYRLLVQLIKNISPNSTIASYDKFNNSVNALKTTVNKHRVRHKKFNTIINTLSSISDYLNTTKNKMPAATETSKTRFTELINNGFVISEKRGKLKQNNHFYGNVNNIVGGMQEVYGLIRVNDALKNKLIDGKIYKAKMTGDQKDIEIKRAGNIVKMTNARDLTITTDGDGNPTLSIGVTIKKYTLDKNDFANISLRKSNFNTVLQSLKYGYSGKLILPETNAVLRLFGHSFHEYKSYNTSDIKYAKEAKYRGYTNFKEMINITQKIAGLILLDNLIGQGDFKKQGLQLMIINGKMKTLEEFFPNKLPHPDGLGPTPLRKIAEDNTTPSFYTANSLNDYYKYLLRYSELAITLRYRMKV